MGGEEGDPQQGKGTGRGAKPGLQLQPPSGSLWASRLLALGRPFVKAKPGGVGVGLGERRGPGTKMSRAGSGAHTHIHIHPLAARRARLLRHTSVHAFILARITHMQICNGAHECLHAHKFIGSRVCANTPGSGKCLQTFSLHRPEALHAFALRRVPRLELGEGVEELNARISFHRVFPLPFTLPFSHKSIQAPVLKMTRERRTWRSPVCSSSPDPEDLRYLHPPHSQAWLLPLPPRARFRAEQYIPAARSARPPPSFPFSPPPVRGPERAPAVNSPGTPLGAGGRARSPPPDPAPPHPAQAVASAAAESPAPSSAAESLYPSQPELSFLSSVPGRLPPSPRSPISRLTLPKRL